MDIIDAPPGPHQKKMKVTKNSLLQVGIPVQDPFRFQGVFSV